MSAEDKIMHYRAVDAQAGQLHMLADVWHELVRARATQARIHTIRATGGLYAGLVSLFVGAPIVYGVLPQTVFRLPSACWVAILVLLAVLYVAWAVCQTLKARSEQAALMKLFRDHRAERPLDQQPWYMQMKISLIGSRLAIASEVLAAADCSATARERFSAIRRYFIRELAEIESGAADQKRQGTITRDESSEIAEWVRLAKLGSEVEKG